ncbi:MAG: 16S rRNA (uracil(1498)-N(3))-methyltransferase [Porticoccaceae bacterium]|nr:16S rRNA (uracil(1498)-N(3))-methyltransferase [Porticoccaceae bacterium]
MNLLLFQPEDFVDSQLARVHGRRLSHLREILQPEPGDVLRAGLLDGPLGTATLLHLDTERAEFSVHLDSSPPPPSPVTLLLALPRPKVLRRALRAATLLGVKEIHLIHSWRVDKSYWQTPLLAPERLREELLLALELARDTLLPRVFSHRRFKPLVEDELDAIAGTRRRLIAHPGAGGAMDAARGQPLILALGPEGGFIPYEVESFRQRGFTPVSLGDRILSVEVALTAALGVLARA